MYDVAQEYYDLIYKNKNYKEETEYLNKILSKRGFGLQSELLDTACGTGGHIHFLKEYYKIEGLDLSKQAVKNAKEKYRNINFYCGNMMNFRLKKRYDIITCLFSSIGYILNKKGLEKTIGNFKRHLKSPGVILVEPWFPPESWHPGSMHLNVHEDDEKKIVRMSTSLKKGNISYFDLHFLIGTAEGTKHVVEHHEMALYSRKEMEDAFTNNGLNVEYDSKGPSGRGLYIGTWK